MKAFATRHIIAEQYDSMGELIRALKSRDYSPYYKHAVDKGKVEKNFAYADQMEMKTGVGGFVSVNESLDMALHGTDIFDDLIANNAVSGFQLESDDRMELDIKRPVNSMVGSSPNVGRFIAGRPDSMRKRVKRDYSVRRNISIIYTLDTPHFVSVETRLNCGLMMINALKALQSNGYSIEFSIGYACGNPEQGLTYFLEIPMKSYGTLLDVRKIIFPIAGLASLFHIGRNWQEKMPVGLYLYRFGMSAWNDETQRGYMQRYFRKKNQVWLNTDIMTTLGADKKEGMGKLVDFILNEKEIDADPRDDDYDGSDDIIVNRYQSTNADSADIDYNKVWEGLQLRDEKHPDSDKPLTQRTKNVAIAGIVDNMTTKDVIKNNNQLTRLNGKEIIKVSWWTLRMNSIRNWWHSLFTDARGAF